MADEMNTNKRSDCWGYQETICLLENWAEEKIQRDLDSTPRSNLKVFQGILSSMKQVIPDMQRKPEELRAKLKRLKRQYFDFKDSSKKSGTGRGRPPTGYEILDRVLGKRPMLRPVAIENSMDQVLVEEEEEERERTTQGEKDNGKENK